MTEYGSNYNTASMPMYYYATKAEEQRIKVNRLRDDIGTHSQSNRTGQGQSSNSFAPSTRLYPADYIHSSMRLHEIRLEYALFFPGYLLLLLLLLLFLLEYSSRSVQAASAARILETHAFIAILDFLFR